MSDAADAPFPPDEICAQAQGNAAAWILTIIAYLKERGGGGRGLRSLPRAQLRAGVGMVARSSGRRGSTAGGAERAIGGGYVALAI